MRLALVNMPWAAVEVPSLALGILRRVALETMPGVTVEVSYVNLTFADWIAEQLGLGLADYEYLAQTTYSLGVGDWVFSSALYGDPRWREAEFVAERGRALSGERIGQAVALHRSAPRFVAEQAERLAGWRPDVVGFTSTFQQNVAALAMAREVKRRSPATVTVFGGANCEGSQGVALHRNFDFVDLVCRGEGEEAFAALLRTLADRDVTPDALARIPGLCWRRPAIDRPGETTANAPAAQPLAPSALRAPDYTDFFAQLATTRTGSAVAPVLVVEGARGCWWGEKHHCTFCGLNGESMSFRGKSPERFRDEVLDLVTRHRVLDVSVVDNILDMGYLTSTLPMLAGAGYDLRMNYEIKSNLRYDQLAALAGGGVSTVQPGIESLSSRVLKIMRKGVSGVHNVRLLRDAESLGLTVVWNYLYGFPGETALDYQTVVDQLPALHHLPPPDSCGRIAIERFSPYAEDPSLGFTPVSPSRQYAVTYDLPAPQLHDLAYLFDAAPRGIGGAMAEVVESAMRDWRRHNPGSRLCYYDAGDAIVLVSRRPAFHWAVRQLVDPVEVSVFRALDQPRTAASLARVAGAAGGADLVGLLRRWRELGLLFVEDGRFIHVATRGANQDLHRLDPERHPVGRAVA